MFVSTDGGGEASQSEKKKKKKKKRDSEAMQTGAEASPQEGKTRLY